MNDEATKQYRSLSAFLGMAIAHEVVHMFVTFLNGEVYQDTPENTDYDPETGVKSSAGSVISDSNDEKDPGHSGRLWEYYMWNGIAEYSYLKERPTRGLIYISREGRSRGEVIEHMVPDEIAHRLGEDGRGRSHSRFLQYAEEVDHLAS